MAPFIVVWAAMAVAILALAAWRQAIDIHEDDSIHLQDGQTGLMKNRFAWAGKIKSIDRAGKTHKIMAATYGLALAGGVVYRQSL